MLKSISIFVIDDSTFMKVVTTGSIYLDDPKSIAGLWAIYQRFFKIDQ